MKSCDNDYSLARFSIKSLRVRASSCNNSHASQSDSKYIISHNFTNLNHVSRNLIPVKINATKNES